jgi:hypothetical protein
MDHHPEEAGNNSAASVRTRARLTLFSHLTKRGRVPAQQLRDINVDYSDGVAEPRPEGSDTTSAASSRVRGSASCRARLSFSDSATGYLPQTHSPPLY